MPSADDRPALYAVEGGILSLSGEALQAFLRDVLGRGLPFRFTARGMSMDPFIRDGDVVTIVPCAAGRPRTGDVVAICDPRDEHLVVHRVVAVVPGGLLVRGDANDAADGVVPRRGAFGVVSAVQRRGRHVTLGSGPERLLLAWLSRFGLLNRLVELARRVVAAIRLHLRGTRAARGNDSD